MLLAGNVRLESVTVTLGGDILVITMHGVLSAAEKALAASPAGAAQLQEFYQQLFKLSSDPFRREITRITGLEIGEVAKEKATAAVQVFSVGTVVQVFLLAGSVPTDTWTQSEPDHVAENTNHPNSKHHRSAASKHEAAAYDHRQAAHHLDNSNHEEAKKHAASASNHSQDADRHSKTAHRQSHK